MIVGIARETFAGEHRVALVPEAVSGLASCNADILIEPGAGDAAGYADAVYVDRGAEVAADRDEVFARADVVFQVRTLGANPEAGRADLARIRSGQVLIGASDPLTAGPELSALADAGATLFAMELIPRITRAQSMDVLSSMATIAGYKAVLLAAEALPRMFPLLMTAAGTLTPARVLVVGAGVAGLQAIATARRLGAVIRAYDVRPAVKEQVESLGAEFVELDIDAGDSGGRGWVRAGAGRGVLPPPARGTGQSRRPERRDHHHGRHTGATGPFVDYGGRRADHGAWSVVIVDLAAERGGNCELTRPGGDVRRGRSTDHGAAQSTGDRATPRQPNVLAQYRNLLSSLGGRRGVAIRYGGRNHARDLGGARR